MGFVERLLNKFGYIKADNMDGMGGTTQPSSYPSSLPSSDRQEDINRQDTDKNHFDDNKHDIIEPSPTGAPENISPPVFPEVHLNHTQTESVQVASPENSMAMPDPKNDTSKSTENVGYDVSQHNLNTDIGDLPAANGLNPAIASLYMDVDEVNKISPAIAKKLQKIGIKFVSRGMFMEGYHQLVRKAHLEKKPLSEYINEVM